MTARARDHIHVVNIANWSQCLNIQGNPERCPLRSKYPVYLTLEAGAVTEEPPISFMVWAYQQMRKHLISIQKSLTNIREAEHQVLFIAVDIHIILCWPSRDVN